MSSTGRVPSQIAPQPAATGLPARGHSPASKCLYSQVQPPTPPQLPAPAADQRLLLGGGGGGKQMLWRVPQAPEQSTGLTHCQLLFQTHGVLIPRKSILVPKNPILTIQWAPINHMLRKPCKPQINK